MKVSKKTHACRYTYEHYVYTPCHHSHSCKIYLLWSDIRNKTLNDPSLRVNPGKIKKKNYVYVDFRWTGDRLMIRREERSPFGTVVKPPVGSVTDIKYGVGREVIKKL